MNKKDHHHGHNDVHQLDLDEISSIDSLTKQMSLSGVFGAGRLGKAVDILEMAEMNNAKIFMGLAGAMVPGGMRKVIVQAIRDGRIHCLTTTGANITHDLIETYGGKHIRDVSYDSDLELREQGIDRVYDAFVAQGSFEIFEENIQEFLKIMWENEAKDQQMVLSPSQLIKALGAVIEDENSIVKAAYDMNIPIFVPAISDSVLGLQLWLFSQFNKLLIDPIIDLGIIQDLFHESSSSCAFLLGGGVPKNYTLQASLMASEHYDYAIQITMDRVETGGLSGATLSEAVSWGKIEPEARTATIISDITIALPIIYSSLRQRKQQRDQGN
ncbi:MAG: deoxyhypusine synthase family protein [Candidatus Kariarchaeaceae archaeon]|jgi:deoxyhypusine synthase